MTIITNAWQHGRANHCFQAAFIRWALRLLFMFFMLAAIVSARAANPHAGSYTGPFYVQVSGNSETVLFNSSFKVDEFGRITGTFSGQVDASGNLAWTQPNAYSLTNGLISNGILASTNVNPPVTYRLAANFVMSNFVGSGAVEWRAPSGGGRYLNAVTYGNGRFVAVGHAGTMATSLDGTNWANARVVTAVKEMRDVAFGNGRFVAVGTNWLMTSVNGTSWELSSTNYPFSSLVFGNSQFIAVHTNGTAFSSADGSNWVAVAGAATGQNFTDVDYANGLFLLYGSTGKFQTSADGTTWNTPRTNGTTALSGAAYAAGRWVIGGVNRFITFANATGSDQAATNSLSSYTVTSVAGQANLFVAGTSSIIPPAFSTNGLNWQYANGLSDAIRGVAYGNGVFVAVGSHIQSSVDGRAWTIRSANMPAAVANGGAIAPAYTPFNDEAAFQDSQGRTRRMRVGQNGVIETRFINSAQGSIYFTPADSPTTNTLRRILVSPTTLVVGDKGTIVTYDAATDSWKLVPPVTSADLLDAAYNSGVTVVVGTGGTILTPAGITNWLVRSSGTANNLYTAGSGALLSGFLFIVGGDNGTILTSPDSITWTARTSGVTNRIGYVRGGDYTPSFYAFPADGYSFLVSTNAAATWKQIPIGHPFAVKNPRYDAFYHIDLDGGYRLNVKSGMGFGDTVGGSYLAPNTSANYGAIGSLYSVAQGNGRFVVVGVTNRLVSTNLVNWMAGAPDYVNSEFTAPHAYGVAFGQGLFVAVGNNGMIETSVDGIAWKRRVAPTNSTLNAITYGAGRFVAVGVGGTTFTSTNGINWVDRSFNNAGGNLAGVAYGSERFVAIGTVVGGNSLTRHSTNGIDWISGSTPNLLSGITYGRGQFVAVGNNFNINTSSNGVTWFTRPQSLNSGGYSIAYGGGRFVAVGTRGTAADGATILSSTDTTNWVAEVANSTYDLRGVASGNGQLVMVGDNGVVLSAVTFETNSAPVITGQPTPAGQAVNEGTSVAYTATVTGTGPLSFRWLKNGEPLFNGSGVTGADTATLTLTGVDAVDTASYQLTVWNDYGSDVSQSVALSVNGAPIITLPPTSLVVSNNTPGSFNLEVAGSLPLGFQWYFGGLALTNSSVITGANAEDLFITQSTRTNEGSYFVVITNAYGAVTSSVASLTVLRAPIVIQQPLPVTVFMGQPFSLTVGVDGTGTIRYQWVNNSTNIAGATNQTFSVTNGQISQNGTYYVAISNAYGSTVSAPVQVTVIGPGILRSDIVFTNVRPILDVAALPDGNFVAGGWFEDFLGLNVITKLNLTTLQVSNLTSLLPAGFYEPGFRSIATLTDGSFVVGGSFAGIGPVAPNFTNLVRFLPNGVLDTAFRPANTNNISKMIAQPGGKFLALRAQDIAGPIAYITRYNADGTVDNTFSQISSSGQGFWGMAQQTNGTVWYGANGDGLRKANSDGTGATTVDANVFAGKVFVAQDDRIYYAPSPGGGSLLRRRNADGSSNSFAVQFNNSVHSLVTLPDGKIVVGGNFTTVNGTNINYIAMLNEDGTLNTSFMSPFVTTGGGSINSILLLADGSALLGTSGFNGVRRIQLYMPGLAVQFPPVSQTVNRGTNAIFTVNATGSSPLSYQWRFNGVNISGATNATLTLTNVPDSAAGSYDVLVSNASGTNLSASATLTILGDVQLTSQPVGRALLAGGTTNFAATATGATPITWQWRKNGTNLVGASSNVLTVANVSLSDIALYDVVAANAFSSITSAPAGLSVYSSTNGIGNAAGTIDTNYVPSITASGTPSVTTVTLDANNKVLLTGSFRTFGGQARTNFARLNADLSVDSPSVVLNSAPVPAVGLAGGGFALGGYFSTAGGSARYGLTFYDSAGTLQPQPTLNANGYVDGGYGKNAFAVQPDGKVVVAGYFASVNGQARTNLARLNADGSTDTNFVPAALNQSVNTVAVQPDGKILIGGYFTTVAGVAQAKVARLNTNGTYDATFTNTFSFSLPLGFKLQSDGKIIIHGQGLTAVGGVARSGIARLNTDGSLDTNFNVSITGGSIAVYDVAVEADDKLVIAGSFTTVAGVARKGVARLNANGTLDTAFATGTGVAGGSSLVYSVVKLPAGGYLIGGSFTSFDGISRPGFAKLNGPPIPPLARSILSQPQPQNVVVGGTATFTVVATGTAPLSFQWRKHSTNILNATGASLSITNAQAGDVASYDVVVTDFTGSTPSQSAALTMNAATGFSTWVTGFGISNGLTGPADDADGDGINNLTEYAFGLNPNSPASGQVLTMVTQTVSTVDYPAVQFTRNRAATGVFILTAAAATVDFPSPLPTVESAVDLGGGIDLVTVRSTSPMGTYPTMFFKVTVTQP